MMRTAAIIEVDQVLTGAGVAGVSNIGRISKDRRRAILVAVRSSQPDLPGMVGYCVRASLLAAD